MLVDNDGGTVFARKGNGGAVERGEQSTLGML